MIDLQLASLIAQILIGAGQIGIVYYGISQMMEASRQRAQDSKRQEKDAERRHTESMAALQALIRGLDNQGEALKNQGQALETLIARTGGRGTA